MKRYLFLLTFAFFCSINIYGQSIKFEDLVYLTGLANGDVYNTLMDGNKFKQDYSIMINGHEIEYFKRISAKPDTEKIEVGNFVKLYDGSVLRTLHYTSTQAQDIINMISQAKRYGLKIKFQGADNSNNIYLFDNDYYQISIYLRRDQKSGLVEIKQKEYLGE